MQLTNSNIVNNSGQIVNGDFNNFAQGIQTATLINRGTLNEIGRPTLLPAFNGGYIENYDTIKNFGAIVATGFAVIDNNGDLQNRQDDANPVGHGSLITSDDTVINNFGTMSNGVAGVDFQSEIANGGAITNDGGSITNRATFTNNGTINNFDNGLISNAANQGSSKLTNNGRILNKVDGTITNAELVINDSNGTLINNGAFHNDGTIINAGQFTIADGSSVDGAGSYNQTGGKTIVNGSLSQSSVILQDGSFGGHGTVNGSLIDPANHPVDFEQFGGTLAPGDPVTLTIDGNYSIFGGVLEIAIASLTDFDRLIVTGAADFAKGTIQLDFINGFAPHAGDVFNFLVTDSATFTFGNIAFLVTGLAPGFDGNVAMDANGHGLVLNAFSDGISTTAPVPLPASDKLLALAGGLLLGKISRRRRIATST